MRMPIKDLFSNLEQMKITRVKKEFLHLCGVAINEKIDKVL